MVDTMPPKQKCVETYCKKVFLAEREKVEQQFAKDAKKTYVPLKEMKDKSLAKMMERAYVDNCKEIYCSPTCGFAKSVDKDRKAKLVKKGATSACRDLVKEFPKYYKKTGNV